MHQEFDGNRICGVRRRCQRATGGNGTTGVGQPVQQHGQRRLHGGEDAGAGRRDRSRSRIVGDLEQGRAVLEDGGVAFDMEGEHRRADHHNEVVVAQRVGQLCR